MVKFSEIIYFNLLKKATILLVIVGIILGIFVVFFTIGWVSDFKNISKASLTSCSENVDCFEWCEECVSIRDARTCTPVGLSCECINRTCQQT